VRGRGRGESATPRAGARAWCEAARAGARAAPCAAVLGSTGRAAGCEQHDVPGVTKADDRPPGVSAASSSVTSAPALARASAAPKPPQPPPTTTARRRRGAAWGRRPLGDGTSRAVAPASAPMGAGPGCPGACCSPPSPLLPPGCAEARVRVGCGAFAGRPTIGGGALAEIGPRLAARSLSGFSRIFNHYCIGYPMRSVTMRSARSGGSRTPQSLTELVSKPGLSPKRQLKTEASCRR
jgi:hypothetical protein